MKILLAGFLFAAVALTSFAQCTSCTISITGTDATDRQIGIGQVLCVQPTGNLTGRIYVGSGGKLCNQGHINSHVIGVAVGGEFQNDGVAHIDTFYISGPSAVLTNSDSMTTNLFYTGPSVTITNNGVMTSTVYGDTAASFTNNGTFNISTNIYVGNTSTFVNNRHLTVDGNFYCGSTANFTTNCIVSVRGDWYNAGIISGPLTGCGGFSVGGQTLNSGTSGATGHIDICDAGHPTLGVDGNSGNLASTTFCQCTDTCSAVVLNSIRQVANSEIDFSIYPNPASDKVRITFTEEIEGNITIQNTLGEIVQKSNLPQGTKEMSLNTAALSNGFYIVTVESGGVRTSRKIEIIK